MKKALFAFLLVFAVAPFSVDASFDLQQLDGSQVVGSSTAGNKNLTFWLGQADGTEVIQSITIGVYAPAGGQISTIKYRCEATLATSSPLSQTGCVNTAWIESDSVTLTNGGAFTMSLYTARFSSQTPLQAGKYYRVGVDFFTTGGIYIFGGSSLQIPGQCKVNGSFSDIGCTGTPFYSIGQIPFSSISVSTATSSSFWSGATASSTLVDLAGQCSTTGNVFAEALCTAASFLFVPSVTTIDNLRDLKLQASTKIPFSYVASINDTITEVASSTDSSSFPLFRIPLSDFGSSTMTGIIPDLELSTSTISTYLPDSVRNALKLLIASLIWLGAGWFAYGEGMRLIRPRT